MTDLRSDPDGYARTGALFNGEILTEPEHLDESPSVAPDVTYSLVLDPSDG